MKMTTVSNLTPASDIPLTGLLRIPRESLEEWLKPAA